MACKCVCTCPLEVGDKIRYKLDPDGSKVRLNGALNLYLAYLGTEHVIFTWQVKKVDRQGIYDRGECYITRAEFDRKIERDPDA